MTLNLPQFCRDVSEFKEIVADTYFQVSKMEYKLHRLYEVRNKIDMFIVEEEDCNDRAIDLLDTCENNILYLTEILVKKRDRLRTLLELNSIL